MISWVRKVGQFPEWTERLDPSDSAALGTYEPLYRRGLACENESFGIGAHAYYRRIVEDLVRAMLAERRGQLEGEALQTFDAQVAVLERDWSGARAIDLVKDMLPEEARPGGVNPLGLLYEAFSGGLHTTNDEDAATECEQLRPILIGLFRQLQRTRESAAFAGAINDFRRRREQESPALPSEGNVSGPKPSS